MKLKIVLLTILVSLCMALYVSFHKIHSLNNQLRVSKANEKALLANISGLTDTTNYLRMSVEQIKYQKDSLFRILQDVIDESKVKDKNIKQLQYQLIQSSKVDTIVFNDTIFKSSSINIDTTLGDKWYQLNLKLQYPNTIIANPMFINETITMFSYQKETINPPKKFFLWRWFQKKHKLVKVQVIQNNPYTTNKKQQFIDIVK